MHREILNADQVALLPLISTFKKEFYMVGGTAIALHVGHRQSIDFDLFKPSRLNRKKIVDCIKSFTNDYQITRNVEEQLNLIIKNVKFTFYEYPFPIHAKTNFDNIIKLPDLLTLAAMKAYALGRRSKWKDYVDLYVIIKDHFSIGEISNAAGIIFQDMFSEKLFRVQLSYFDDIDFSETIEFIGEGVSELQVKNLLIQKASEIF